MVHEVVELGRKREPGTHEKRTDSGGVAGVRETVGRRSSSSLAASIGSEQSKPSGQQCDRWWPSGSACNIR